jgi:chemotaxis response regulator CheB
MRTRAHHPAGGARPTRIVIIDDHEISRAACRALLRTEGLDVVADLAAGDQPLTAARALRPDVAIIDVTPAADTGFSIADGLLALPAPPTVILTSSTDRTDFGTRLDGHRFIAKADVCAAAITSPTENTAPADPPPSAPATGRRRPAHLQAGGTTSEASRMS